MTQNHRETFRITLDSELQSTLEQAGASSPCELVDLSAGGARLRSTVQPGVGELCTLHLQLMAHGPEARIKLKVLAVTEQTDSWLMRLQNLTEPGSIEHERLTKLVFELQRRQLARASGTDDASPMVSDPERREKLRPPRPARYTKKSLRPDAD